MSTRPPKKIAEAPDAAPATRRQPLQQRSQERVELILQIASERIAESGSGPLKMSEIAEQAGMSIGSLYRYFPDKRAILRTLAQQCAAECHDCITQKLAPVRTRAELETAFNELVDEYHALLLEKPLMRDIVFGMRADKELAAMELAASRTSGALLAEAIRRVHPRADAKKLDTLAFLVWQLGEETMRLAMDSPRGEAKQLVEAYKRMSLKAIEPPWL